MPDVQILVGAIAKSNGTLVPNSLVLGSYANEATHELAARRIAF